MKMSCKRSLGQPGKLPIWIEVTVPVTKAELTSHFGKKCKHYAKGCGCCEAWKQWEKTGKVTCLIERAELLKG